MNKCTKENCPMNAETLNPDCDLKSCPYRTELMNNCIECAKEHRQLAEWLKELKELRDFANFVAESVMEEDFEEGSDVYAEVFCRKLYKMGYIESIDGKWIFNDNEVNADEDSDNDR